MNIRCYCDLYVSEKYYDKKNKILKKLMDHDFSSKIYLITLPVCDHNQLEFFASSQLLQPAYEDSDIFIVGIAENREAALELVAAITAEIVAITGEANIRSYIEERQASFMKE